MKRMVSEVEAEGLAQELKDLGTRGDDELKERAQAVRDGATEQNSPLAADPGVRLPHAGECAGRTQAIRPPPVNQDRQQHGDSPTITELPEPTS